MRMAEAWHTIVQSNIQISMTEIDKIARQSSCRTPCAVNELLGVHREAMVEHDSDGDRPSLCCPVGLVRTHHENATTSIKCMQYLSSRHALHISWRSVEEPTPISIALQLDILNVHSCSPLTTSCHCQPKSLRNSMIRTNIGSTRHARRLRLPCLLKDGVDLSLHLVCTILADSARNTAHRYSH